MCGEELKKCTLIQQNVTGSFITENRIMWVSESRGVFLEILSKGVRLQLSELLRYSITSDTSCCSIRGRREYK